jgi:hypothetical protein
LYDGIETKQFALELETQFMMDFDSVENGCNMRYSVRVPQKQQEYKKQYRHKNAEKIKQYQQENSEEIREYQNQYRIDNAEKIREHKNKKVPCDICHAEITHANLARHQKSNKCKSVANASSNEPLNQ